MVNQIINDNSKIGKNVKIEPFSIIENNVIIKDNVTIGNGTIIRENTLINENSKIGSHCEIGHHSKKDMVNIDHSYYDEKIRDLIITEPKTIIGDNSVIRSGSVIYNHTIIGNNFNTGHNVVIREHTNIDINCVIGTNSVINGYSTIGKNTRINTLCALPQSMRIGKGVFIAPLVSFSDNKYALPGEGNHGAVIKDYVRIGIGATILPNITINRGSIVGANSLVNRTLPKNSLAFGVPAKVIKIISNTDLEKYIKSIHSWK